MKYVRFIGILLFIVILLRLDLGQLSQTFQRVNAVVLSIAFFLNLPMVFFKVLRWKMTLATQGIQYGLGKSFLAYTGSIYIGLITPGRLGEFVKTVHITQDCQVSTGKALSSVLVDRLFDLYALLTIGGIALLTWVSASWSNTESAAYAFWGFVALCAMLILPLIIFLNDGLFASIRRLSTYLGKLGKNLFKDDGLLMQLRNGLQQLSWAWFGAGIILTVISYSIFFFQSYLIAVSLSIPIQITEAMYAVSIGSLITFIPISISGIGTRDAAIVAYLTSLQIDGESAIAFSLLIFFTIQVGGGLVGAVSWWLKPVSIQFARQNKSAISSNGEQLT
ncbi:MAG: lysylphosphatidylglycerol synthase transmembrane domain-containing protein [Chloroflexota bacterium]